MPELRRLRPTTVRRLLAGCCTIAAAILGVLCVPELASAQTDKWQVDVAPLYFWASELNGTVSVDDNSIPVFMEFSDAKDKLAGAFAVHLEARKNRWGFLTDINFVRLSTDATFTTPVLGRSVTGTAQMDNTMFEVGGSYLVHPEANFSAIGGIRTYTLSPKLEFESAAQELTPVDVSKTAVGVFGGFTYRPKLSDKWTLLTRADLGGGEAFTWSALVGFEYRFKPWGGVMFGYRGLGIDTGDTDTGTKTLAYDMTHYGPMFSLTLHWMQK
jgi:hypothetical protein